MITVIGGSGFIGTRLCNILSKENIHPFVIIDKAESLKHPDKFLFCDVRSFDKLTNLIPNESIIINLAAEHKDDVRPKSLYQEVNVDGAKNICDVARLKNINTIIFTSSVAVYGFSASDTDEDALINPFNDYGKSKYAAENIYKIWQEELPMERTLVIIRPTVVFGEDNRGNVYNLLRQIASKKFIPIGLGKNKKSMAYVENIAAFILYSLKYKKGLFIFNYVDKPDFQINELISLVNYTIGIKNPSSFRIPYFIGISIGYIFDLYSLIFNKKLVISSIRIKKYCSDSVFNSSIAKTGFSPPVTLVDGLIKTLKHEFIQDSKSLPHSKTKSLSE